MPQVVMLRIYDIETAEALCRNTVVLTTDRRTTSSRMFGVDGPENWPPRTQCHPAHP